MAPLTTAQVRTLLTPPATPCVSLYLPTHRTEPDRREDPIRYRKLVQTAEERLRAKHPAGQVQAILRKFHALTDDTAFWSSSQDGLAVLAAGTCSRRTGCRGRFRSWRWWPTASTSSRCCGSPRGPAGSMCSG